MSLDTIVNHLSFIVERPPSAETLVLFSYYKVGGSDVSSVASVINPDRWKLCFIVMTGSSSSPGSLHGLSNLWDRDKIRVLDVSSVALAIDPGRWESFWFSILMSCCPGSVDIPTLANELSSEVSDWLSPRVSAVESDVTNIRLRFSRGSDLNEISQKLTAQLVEEIVS